MKTKLSSIFKVRDGRLIGLLTEAIFIVVCFLSLTSSAEVALDSTPFAVAERGPHHRVWERTSERVGLNGTVTKQSHSYVEVASGMHYPKDGQWVESKEKIEIDEAQGIGVARQGQHQVIFGGNINSFGALDLLTMDDKRFVGHVLGLAYTSKKTGEGVMFSVLKDSTGLVTGNEVRYPDCFTDGVIADVRWTYTKAGFEQDVILRNRLPSPADFGLDPTEVWLEVYTEFAEAPVPKKRTTIVQRQPDALRAGMTEPDLIEEYLDFGWMHMVGGVAFPLGTDSNNKLITGKTWEIREGRTLLIERVDYAAAAGFINGLPQAALRNGNAQRVLASKAKLPPQPDHASRAQPDRKVIRTAELRNKEKGYVLDFVLLNAVTNFTFKSDTTYLVASGVGLHDLTTIEAGAVIKLTNSSSMLFIYGNLNCETRAYHPAIFTSAHDHTVGERIGSATNSPSGYYGNALYFQTTGLSHDVHDLHFRYLDNGILCPTNVSIEVRNCIFESQNACVHGFAGATLRLRNILAEKCVLLFSGTSNTTLSLEHGTAHDVQTFKGFFQTVYVTNSLLIGVTNSLSYIGSHVIANQDDAGYFQTVGQGRNYLAANSPYRDYGTTNIDPGLFTALMGKTTFPPTVLTNPVNVSDVMLAPHVKRDDDSLPDLGFHYNAMDYLASDLHVDEAMLMVTNGAVIGISATATNSGVRVQEGAKLISGGGPLKTNRFVRTHCVQEIPAGGADNYTPIILVQPFAGPVTINCRFTEFPLMAASYLFNDTEGDNGPYSSFTLRDTQIRGGVFFLSPSETNCVIGWTNVLLDRVKATIWPAVAMTLQFRNDLFRGGSWSLAPATGSTWTMKDNLFDYTTFTQSGSGTITGDYNGYLTNASRLTPNGANDRVVASDTVGYQTGFFGNFYLPASSEFIDHGSANANSVGLYHYTTTTNQVKETTSTVDIGLHWIALDSSNLPADADSDGIPDYYEDVDGDGTFDAGETDWNNANNLALKVLITRPKDGMLLP